MRELESATADALSLPDLKDGVSRAKLMTETFQYQKVEQKLADRHNIGKPKLSYICTAPNALNSLATIFQYGAEVKNYGKHNWKKGLTLTSLIDSLDRHKLAFLNGEDNDPESTLPHVGHILWNALILAEMYYTRTDLDDRYKEELK